MPEQRLIDANALMEAFRKHLKEKYKFKKCTSIEKCKICERCLWYEVIKAAPTVKG